VVSNAEMCKKVLPVTAFGEWNAVLPYAIGPESPKAVCPLAQSGAEDHPGS